MLKFIARAAEMSLKLTYDQMVGIFTQQYNHERENYLYDKDPKGYKNRIVS